MSWGTHCVTADRSASTKFNLSSLVYCILLEKNGLLRVDRKYPRLDQQNKNEVILSQKNSAAELPGMSVCIAGGPA